MENTVQLWILLHRSGDFAQKRFRFLNAIAGPDDSDAELTDIFPIGVAVRPVCRQPRTRIDASMIAAKNKFRLF